MKESCRISDWSRKEKENIVRESIISLFLSRAPIRVEAHRFDKRAKINAANPRN